MSNASFACAINCMDGRTQEPVARYLKEKLGVQYVDEVTEPGPIKFLVDGTPAWVDNIKTCCDVSVLKHNARAVAVIGHHDCAGNPQPREVQEEQIRISVQKVRAWYPEVAIYGLWVNDSWEVEEIVVDLPE